MNSNNFVTEDTGKQDKNGKSIHNGDRLKADSINNLAFGEYKVYWSKGGYLLSPSISLDEVPSSKLEKLK